MRQWRHCWECRVPTGRTLGLVAAACHTPCSSGRRLISRTCCQSFSGIWHRRGRHRDGLADAGRRGALAPGEQAHGAAVDRRGHSAGSQGRQRRADLPTGARRVVRGTGVGQSTTATAGQCPGCRHCRPPCATASRRAAVERLRAGLRRIDGISGLVSRRARPYRAQGKESTRLSGNSGGPGETP